MPNWRTAATSGRVPAYADVAGMAGGRARGGAAVRAPAHALGALQGSGSVLHVWGRHHRGPKNEVAVASGGAGVGPQPILATAAAA